MADKEPLFTVQFPDNARVTGAPGQILVDDSGEPTRTIQVPFEKAMKLARMNDASVTDPEGLVVAKPTVTLTDDRPEAASKRAEKAEAENVKLRERLDKLEAALVGKADRPGPKPGSKPRK